MDSKTRKRIYARTQPRVALTQTDQPPSNSRKIGKKCGYDASKVETDKQSNDKAGEASYQSKKKPFTTDEVMNT